MKVTSLFLTAAFLLGGVGTSFAGRTIIVLEQDGSQITILPSAAEAKFDAKTGELLEAAPSMDLEDLGRELAAAGRSIRKEARIKALCELEDLTNPSRSRRCRHDSK